MVRAELLSFDEFFVYRQVFDRGACAEGSWGWFKALADTTLEDEERALVLGLFSAEGEPLAALPIATSPSGVIRALSAPYTTIFAPAIFEAELAKCLGLHLGRATRSFLDIGPLPNDSITSALIEGLRASGLQVARYFHFPNRFESVVDFGSYWNERPSRLRHTLKRKYSRAARTYNLGFTYANAKDQLRSAALAYADVYEQSWKVPEPHPLFISNLVQELAEEKTIRIGTLSFDGKVASAQIWLVRNAKATIFKLAHRQEFDAFSPGTLLTRWMIEEVCSREGVTEIDFGRGDDVYKRDWLPRTRPRIGVLACSWKSLGGILSFFSKVLPTRISNLKAGLNAPENR